MTVTNEVIQEIQRNNTFLVPTYINPEGDALGSALALALQTLGRKALVVNRDPLLRSLDLSFLPGSPSAERSEITRSTHASCRKGSDPRSAYGS